MYVSGSLNGVTLKATAQDGGWWLVIGMPAKPAALQLSAGTSTRVLVLDARVDSAPALVLRDPARDSVLRRPTGRFALRADVRDDHGVADGNFEMIVSSGSGESFVFRTVVLGSVDFRGAREGALSGSLSIDSPGLRPGDLVHLRAVARDRNDVSGPGVGASESRTLRIIRADEYDSVAVEALPSPEAEASALSQRMVLIMTQALEKKRRSLARDALVRESLNLAIEQARLRKRVAALIFERLGSGDAGEEEEGLAAMESRGRPVNPDSVLAEASLATGTGEAKVLDFEADETPVVKINRPLLEAYNAMWEATTALEVARPGEAIPPMQRALAAIERSRAAERFICAASGSGWWWTSPGYARRARTRPPPAARARARRSIARAWRDWRALMARSPARRRRCGRGEGRAAAVARRTARFRRLLGARAGCGARSAASRGRRHERAGAGAAHTRRRFRYARCPERMGAAR